MLGRLAAVLLGATALTPVAAQAGVVSYADGEDKSAPITLIDNSTQLEVTAGSATQSGVISDGGGGFGLEKIGAGALTLSGANTYSGATTLTEGSLIVGNATALGDPSSPLFIFNSSTIGTAGDFTIANAIFMDSDGTFDSAGHILTLSGVVTGQHALIKTGSGTLVLADTTAGNIWNDGTFINQGTLRIDDDYALTGAVTIASGAKFDLNGHSTAPFFGLSDLSGLGNVTNSAGTISTLYLAPASSTTFDGVIEDGTGGVAVEIDGDVTLTGANTYTKGTFICACSSLHIGDGGTTGSIQGDVTVEGTLTFNRSDDIVFDGNIDGAGGFVVKRGAGRLTLTGNNSYDGGTDIREGTLVIGSATALGDPAGMISFLGVSTLSANGDYVIANPVDIRRDATIDTAGHTLELSGDVGGTNHSLTKTGAGTLILSNGFNSGWGGGTFINHGTLQLGADDALGGDVEIAGGGFLDMHGFSVNFGIGLTGAGTGTVTNSASTASTLTLAAPFPETFAGVIADGTGGINVQIDGDVTFTGANTYTGGTFICSCSTLQIGNGGTTGSILGDVDNEGLLVFNRSDSYTFAGIISDGGFGGVVEQRGPGTLTLNVANSYGGGTLLTAGTLAIGDNDALGSGDLTIAPGATLSFATTGGNATGTRFTIANNIAVEGDTVSPSILTVADGEIDEISGSLYDSGSPGVIQKTGNGTLILSGSSSHTGGTVISAGTLQIGDDANLGDGSAPVTINGGALAFSSDVALGGRVVTLAPGNGTFDVAGALVLFPGKLTGPGRLTVTGQGIIVLSGFGNDYSGGTRITGNAQAYITEDAALGQAGSGITLDHGGAFVYLGALAPDPSRTITLGDGGGTILAVTEVANTITGNGGLNLIGAIALSGINDYSGGTTIGGPLPDGTVWPGSSVFITDDRNLGATGAGLTLNGGTLVFGTDMVFDRPVTLTGNGGAFDANSYQSTIKSAISGTGDLVFYDSGVLTYTGTDSHVGNIYIDIGGTLVLGDGGANGTLASGGNLFMDGTLILNRSDSYTLDKTLADSPFFGQGTVVQSGSGTTILTGANTYTGTTTVSAGALQVGNGGTSGTLGTGAITDNATLAFNRSDTVTLNFAITGSGVVQQMGPGLLSVTTAQAYTGGSTVSAGTFRLDAGGSLQSTAALTIDGGTFDLNGHTQTVNRLSGAGGVLSLGAGTLTIANTSGQSGTLASTITGTGGLILSSGGLMLTGNNSFSGGIQVAGDLGLGSDTAAGTGPITTTGSVIDYANGFTIANAIIVNSNSTQLKVLVGSATQSGNISQAGGARPLEKIGGGTLILTGTNSYTGITTITGGTLALGSAGALGGGGQVRVENSATLAVNISAGFTNALRFDGLIGTVKAAQGVVANLGDIVAASATPGSTIQFGTADASGNGVLTFGGSATPNANTALLIAGGTLRDGLGAITTLVDNSTSVTVLSGATLDLNGRFSLRPIHGATLNGAGAVKLGSATPNILYLRGGDFSGVISGLGQVDVVSGGVVTLSGANTYTGNTVIESGGQLQLGNGGTTGTLAGVITDNGTLVINRSDNLVIFPAAVTGSGSLVQAGSGTLILGNTNGYTGGTVIRAGSTLQVGTGGTSGALNGAITDDGNLVFNRSDAMSVSTALISGAGTVAQAGAGTLTLTGTGGYTGTTTATSGTLVVDGNLSHSAVTGAANSVVMGTGTTGNLTVNGALSPGDNGIGTLNVAGNLVLGSGSSFGAELSSSAADKLLVSGNATLNGHLFASFANSGGYAAGQYALVTSTGTLSGTFTAFDTLGLPAGFTASLSYDAHDVFLTLVQAYDWKASPLSGDYNNGANWSNNAAPPSGQTGRLAASSITNLTVATDTISGGLAFQAGAPAYVINVTGGTFTLDGAGIRDSSANAPTLNLSGGNLTFANAASAGDAAINVGAGSTLRFQGTATPGTASIGGAGALDISGITAAEFDMTKLAVTGGVNLGATSLGLDASGGAISFGGTISGNGKLLVNQGTVIFSGTGNQTGGTVIAGGAILQLGNGTTSGTLTGAVSDSGTLVFNPTGTATFGAAIGGSGKVVHSSSGTTILTASSNYTGTTTVSAGTLVVNGALTNSDVTLSGGTLKGGGFVHGLTATSGSTVAPGNSIGTLGVGNIAFAAGSAYQVEVNAAGQSDLINATGTASLNGVVQAVPAAGSYAPITTYRILNATGGISGTFAPATSDGNFAPSLRYGATSVDLTLTRTDLAFGTSYGVTTNQINTGGAVSAGGVFTSIYNTLAAVAMTPSAVSPALDALSGEIHASLRSAAIEDGRILRVTLIDQLSRGGDGTRVWGSGFVSSGSLGSDGNAGDLSHTNGGGIVGADMMLEGGVRAGVAAAYTAHHAGLASRASQASGDAANLMAYAGWSGEALRLKAGAIFGWGNDTIIRTVAFLSEADTSRRSSDSTQLFADLGYAIEGQGLTLVPHAGLAWMRAGSGAFRETGGAQSALGGDAGDDAATYGILGVRADTKGISLGENSSLAPYIDLGIEHAFDSIRPDQMLAFGANRFTVYGAPLARDAATIAVGTTAQLSDAASLSLGYDGKFSDAARMHAIRARFDWAL